MSCEYDNMPRLNNTLKLHNFSFDVKSLLFSTKASFFLANIHTRYSLDLRCPFSQCCDQTEVMARVSPRVSYHRINHMHQFNILVLTTSCSLSRLWLFSAEKSSETFHSKGAVLSLPRTMLTRIFFKSNWANKHRTLAPRPTKTYILYWPTCW